MTTITAPIVASVWKLLVEVSDEVDEGATVAVLESMKMEIPLHAPAAGRVVDVPVRPIYGAHWKSGIHIGTALHPIPWVLLRSWGSRLAAEAIRRARP